MNSKKTGNSIKVKLLIALMSVALVFTMMPLTMGNSYAEDEPVVTDEQVEAVSEETVDIEEPADAEATIDAEEAAGEPEEAAVEAKSEELSAKEAEATVLIKGNVLKQEKAVSASDFAGLIQSGVTFKGVNKSGNLGEVTINKGITFDALINSLGLKKGATIEKFIITTTKIDGGSSATQVTEYSYKWLMTAPDADKFNNGKAMLAFDYDDDKGNHVNTRILLGGFSDMETSQKGTYIDYPMNRPKWIDTIDSIEVVGTVPPVNDGDTAAVSGNTYTVTSAAAGTVALTKAKNTKKVTIPDTVTINGATLKVTKVNANAFTGKKIRTVTLGKNIDTIAKYAFKKSKARTLIVKTKALTKKSVKGSLKKSKIKRVKVKVGTKKENRKFVKKYRKIFKKKNSGKRVKVRR